MATSTEIRERLATPFEPMDIEWRIQQAGLYPALKPDGSIGWAMVLAYVTNRAIQDRLDDAVGIDKWRNSYDAAPDGGIMCGISIKFDEWITKYDGADKTNIEATKGGLSNAMKRAGVQWGIGRYLYNLDSNFVKIYPEREDRTQSYYDKDTKKKYFWSPPSLPKWALPVRNGDESNT